MEHNCGKCVEVDTERMVQCDACNSWYHFDCVGVDSNIADVSWSCEACGRNISATNAKPTASSSPTTEKGKGQSQHVPLLLSALNSQKLDSHVRASTLTTAVLTMATTPVVQSAATATSTSFITTQPCNTGSTSSFARAPTCSDFMRVIPNVTSMGLSALATSTQATDARHFTTFSPVVRSHELGASGFPSSSSPHTFTDVPSRQQMGMPYDKLEKSEMQRNLELERLKEEMEIKQQYLDSKYKILSQFNDVASVSAPTFLQNSGPSPSQLIARQAIPKQLPTFNGDPEEWPLFISNFENSTTVAGYTEAENLIRLQASLKGKARDMVKNKLFLPSMVPEIIHTLRMCFGRPEYILERVVNRARVMPILKDKLECLVDFALCVRNICNTMEACQLHMHLHNPLLVKELVDKLPNNHKLSWALHPKDEKLPIVKQFSDWIFCLAEAASTVVNLAPNKNHASVNTHTVAANAEQVQRNERTSTSRACCACKSHDHKIAQCEVFKTLTLPRKWEIVKANNLCRQCLVPHRRKCFINKVCGKEGCTIKHHPLLHKFIELAVEQVNTHDSGNDEARPFFRIIPVRLYWGGKVINIHAFLDEGSSVTLIDKKVFDQLGVESESAPLCLRWTGNTTRVEEHSKIASLEISSPTSNQRYMIKNIRTIDNLDLPEQSVDIVKMQNKYPYLNGLPIKSYAKIKPSLLIGADNWKLAIPLKVKEGTWSQPIATKTRLGWTLQGYESGQGDTFRLNVHTCDCQVKYDQLHETVKNFFALETPKPTRLFSEDDVKALDIMNSTCRQINYRYEIGLLWRNPIETLPSSYLNAVQRLKCLEKKFIKNPVLRTTMQEQINNLVNKGYARKLSLAEVGIPRAKTWYLPIFVVTNPNKAGKHRLVWDAAAKVNGVSLNHFLLSGPDMLNPLVDILLAFRVGRIAVCGDIAEMFHRINIRDEDMHAQRFLWCDEGDTVQEPSIYVMRALTFGLNCAPCIAHFVRDKNADNYKHIFPRGAEAVKKNHYVDDFIDSEDDEQSALELAKQVKEIHRAAGFDIRGWSSNSKMVLKKLTNDPASVHNVEEWASTTKILGMFWDPNTDNFKYICRFVRLRRDVINDTVAPTKRELLQVLMSIFDPLGFVSCYTIGLKILLQEVWRSGISWDDPLCDELYEKWCCWKNMVPLITAVEIPRCYSFMLKDADCVELHTFVDAGENAYAAVCYLRIIKDNDISTAIVASKSKVAPLKPLSIPRLELQAAVIGTRLASMVAKVQRIGITSMFWWTDSKTVLRWLRMDPRKFHQYVMHRVGEILETSNISQWKWVPSKQNPADLATKVSTSANHNLWFTGPEFLAEKQDAWPHCIEIDSQNDDFKEVRNYVLHIKKPPLGTVKLKVEYFSNWKRLYRAVATFMLYVDILRATVSSKNPTRTISFEMIQKAQQFLIKYAQMDFVEELAFLQRGKTINKSSKLYHLDVFLDAQGIIRSRSRVEHLNNRADAIVLPTSHYVTFLIVRSAHEQFHHQMHEAIINHIRAQYCIPRLRVLYKKVRQKCQRCKNNSSMPQVPQMAALPAARLSAFERPFTYVGVDYFGPLSTVVGRRREKRWGVIFTCLTIRAIHIEIACSLDTSSCIIAIRNFVSRRGYPREIFSDNGTNFRATEKIICNKLKEIEFEKLITSFDQIKWRFNPPGAPHMGGIWERLIRSVKIVLYQILPSTSFNDESLRNALCEVEFLINSRPLTFVSLEDGDDEALTPNHLLIGSSGGYKPICQDYYNLRERWCQTQKFADSFWHRWVKEYVPIIARRSKWFAKALPVRIDDIVVIVDQNLPRNCWPKGKIVDVLKSKDGQVRSAMIETKSGILHRPVAKIAVLDVGVIHGKRTGSSLFTGEGMSPTLSSAEQ